MQRGGPFCTRLNSSIKLMTHANRTKRKPAAVCCQNAETVHELYCHRRTCDGMPVVIHSSPDRHCTIFPSKSATGSGEKCFGDVYILKCSMLPYLGVESFNQLQHTPFCNLNLVEYQHPTLHLFHLPTHLTSSMSEYFVIFTPSEEFSFLRKSFIAIIFSLHICIVLKSKSSQFIVIGWLYCRIQDTYLFSTLKFVCNPYSFRTFPLSFRWKSCQDAYRLM